MRCINLQGTVPVSPAGTGSTKQGYKEYQAVVRTVPSAGTKSTKGWYGQYQATVQVLPPVGMTATTG